MIKEKKSKLFKISLDKHYATKDLQQLKNCA